MMQEEKRSALKLQIRALADDPKAASGNENIEVLKTRNLNFDINKREVAILITAAVDESGHTIENFGHAMLLVKTDKDIAYILDPNSPSQLFTFFRQNLTVEFSNATATSTRLQAPENIVIQLPNGQRIKSFDVFQMLVVGWK
jgi:hypothetical protein